MKKLLILLLVAMLLLLAVAPAMAGNGPPQGDWGGRPGAPGSGGGGSCGHMPGNCNPHWEPPGGGG